MSVNKIDYSDVKPTSSFDDLVRLMEILRVECPWDKKQTHESIKDLMIEEIYEAIDAIDRKEYQELKKELGDLMLHIVFHAVMAKERSEFDINEVIYNIQDKLIRRHPHVFATTDASTAEKVMANWEKIKQTESDRKSVLSGVPSTLPALLRAQRMQEKASGVGFDWKEWEPAWDKLNEELEEFRQHLEDETSEKLADEFGDVMFSLVNVGRLLKLNAEDSLRLTNNKFQRRFEYIEMSLAKRGLKPHEVDLDVMDELWNEAKNSEKSHQS